MTAQAKPPAKTPIEHVVIIIQENHTYDNYFGRYPKGDGDPTLPHADNPPRYTMPFSPTHGHWSWKYREWMGAREQYCGLDLPLYYEYAKGGVLHDRFFTDVAGPSIPNHMFAFAASSGDLLNNPRPAIIRWITRDRTVMPPFNVPTLPENLEKAGLTWVNFGDTAPYNFTGTRASKNNVASELFSGTAEAGRLPTVSWLVAPNMSLNEHPPSNLFAGQDWLGTQVDAVVKGGLWEKTAIIIFWDDWGGYFDHVTPPLIEKWSVDKSSHYRLGSRVPCLTIGGYARPDYVSSVPVSQSSIVKWIEDIFGLPYLNQRDRTANSFADAFDFQQAPNPAPPAHGAILAAAAPVALKHVAEIRAQHRYRRPQVAALRGSGQERTPSRPSLLDQNGRPISTGASAERTAPGTGSGLGL